MRWWLDRLIYAVGFSRFPVLSDAEADTPLENECWQSGVG
jgi:hypothetical protein